MKKGKATTDMRDRDTMRDEYDFAKGVRGTTARRHARGANIVAIDPEVMDVFPDERAVNDALRALAPVVRTRRRALPKKRRTA